MKMRGAPREVICPECGHRQGRLIANIEETQPYQHDQVNGDGAFYYYCLHCHTRFSLIAHNMTTERIEQ